MDGPMAWLILHIFHSCKACSQSPFLLVALYLHVIVNYSIYFNITREYINIAICSSYLTSRSTRRGSQSGTRCGTGVLLHINGRIAFSSSLSLRLQITCNGTGNDYSQLWDLHYSLFKINGAYPCISDLFINAFQTQHGNTTSTW